PDADKRALRLLLVGRSGLRCDDPALRSVDLHLIDASDQGFLSGNQTEGFYIAARGSFIYRECSVKPATSAARNRCIGVCGAACCCAAAACPRSARAAADHYQVMDGIDGRGLPRAKRRIRVGQNALRRNIAARRSVKEEN